MVVVLDTMVCPLHRSGFWGFRSSCESPGGVSIKHELWFPAHRPNQFRPAWGIEGYRRVVDDMFDTQRDAFLDEVRLAVLVIERADKGPLCAPVWYRYNDGAFQISIENDSAKAVLLRRAGRASLCVQDESIPYRYVTAEGPVEVEAISGEVRHELVREMASRYLGDELGRQYADGFPPELDGGALVTLRPRRWRTEMY